MTEIIRLGGLKAIKLNSLESEKIYFDLKSVLAFAMRRLPRVSGL
jgi:hypothetical protein